MNPDESPNITFESEDHQQPVHSTQPQTPKIVRRVIKYSGGYVKNEKQATYILIGFVVVAIIVTFLFVNASRDTSYTVRQQEQAPTGWSSQQ